MDTHMILNCMITIMFIDGILTNQVGQVFRMTSDFTAVGTTCQLWNDVVPSAISCGLTCYKDNRCVRFKYEESGNCSAYCDTNTDIGVSQGDGNDVYVVVPDVGYPCTDAEQCILPYSTCNIGLCTCQVGYRYSPGTNACVKGCSEYGLDFVVYNNTALKDHNFEEYEGVSIEYCQNKCISANQTCPSFDYNFVYTSCKLNDVEWFTANTYDNLENVNEFMFFQRSCVLF